MVKMFKDRYITNAYCFLHKEQYYLLAFEDNAYYICEMKNYKWEEYQDEYLYNINDKVFEFIKEICDQDIPR